jgi:hypothetical protein
MIRSLPILAVLWAALIGCGESGNDAPHPAVPSKYGPGGEYSFTGRTADPQPRFLVLHVDSHPSLGNIVHVAISGIALKNPRATRGVADHVQHLPVAEASLDASGAKLIRSGCPLPDFQDAYMTWRKPFDQGKAGIWTKPLAECLEGMEQGLNGGKK